MHTSLIYVHDPMCSWCWGFEPVKQQLFGALTNEISIQCLVGGLAPDSEEPMSEAMQIKLQNIWRQIEQTIPGTKFNYSFWRECSPRRSTYPANRAIIAARQQGLEFDQMITNKIQQAYYLEARNPSNDTTLVEIADELGLDTNRFSIALNSEKTQLTLANEIALTRSYGANSFPSLILENKDQHIPITINYSDANVMLKQISTHLDKPIRSHINNPYTQNISTYSK